MAGIILKVDISRVHTWLYRVCIWLYGQALVDFILEAISKHWPFLYLNLYVDIGQVYTSVCSYSLGSQTRIVTTKVHKCLSQGGVETMTRTCSSFITICCFAKDRYCHAKKLLVDLLTQKIYFMFHASFKQCNCFLYKLPVTVQFLAIHNEEFFMNSKE